MFGIRGKLRLAVNKYKWRKMNRHNFTMPDNVFNLSLLKVGNGSYGPININSSGNEGTLSIGNYCSIARGVSFVMNNEHPLNHFSTYPFKVMTLGSSTPEALSKGGIVVEDDVWIGQNAIILDGVIIGKGSVVAAGALVTRDVPPYSIVGGSPAKLIRKRFSDEIIERLEAIDLSKIDKHFVEEHLEDLYVPLNEEVLSRLEKGLR